MSYFARHLSSFVQICTTDKAAQDGGANATPETREIENLLLNTRYGGPFVSLDQKKPEAGPSSLNTFAPHPEIYRARPNFSPDPNNFYMSSESVRRDSTYSRLETLPHPSKAYALAFFPSQDLKVGNGSSGRGLPSSTQPASGNPLGSQRTLTHLRQDEQRRKSRVRLQVTWFHQARGMNLI